MTSTSERMTLAQYKSVYRDYVTRHANEHGVPDHEIHEHLQTLDALDTSRLGPGSPIVTAQATRPLPVGTILVCGEPSDYGRFGVWRRARAGVGGWDHLLGGQRRFTYPATVFEYQGSRTVPPELMTTGEITDEDIAAVQDFKAKAWELGQEVKESHGWCSTFEVIMAKIGVTASCVDVATQRRNGVPVYGRVTDYTVCKSLPVGTILGWEHHEHPDTDFAWFMRVADATNLWGTRRIFSLHTHTSRDRHFHERMRVLGYPTETGDWPYTMHLDQDVWQRVWRYLPPGTVFNYHGSSRYIIAQDHRAETLVRRTSIPRAGTHEVGAFGDSLAASPINHIPVPLRET
jgi:hypothetical protein